MNCHIHIFTGDPTDIKGARIHPIPKVMVLEGIKHKALKRDTITPHLLEKDLHGGHDIPL